MCTSPWHRNYQATMKDCTPLSITAGLKGCGSVETRDLP
jgi:hypothetical protein